jgi:hypothetical protein
MPRSDWRVLFALAGLAVVAWAFAQGILIGLSYYPTEKRYQPYRYTTAKPSEMEPATAGQASAQPLQYRTPCRDPQGETESDLCAQWKAANAAADGAYWAKWGFWIACIGSAFLLWQIILTRKAVEDTSEATDAMREANQIARDAARRQLRAYIAVTEIEVRGLVVGKKPSYSCIIKNTGQTPAYGLRSINIVKASLIGPDDFRIRIGKPEYISACDLGPGQEMPHVNRRNHPLTLKEWDLINSGEICMIFAGILTYTDAFGHFRRVTFRYCVDVAKELDRNTGFSGLFPCMKGGRSN